MPSAVRLSYQANPQLIFLRLTVLPIHHLHGSCTRAARTEKKEPPFETETTRRGDFFLYAGVQIKTGKHERRGEAGCSEGIANGEMIRHAIAETLEIVEARARGGVRRMKTYADIETQDEEIKVVAHAGTRAKGYVA